MYLENFPNNYPAKGAIYKRDDDFVYEVKPNHKNGEIDTRVLLSWDNKNKSWIAYLEGIYGDRIGKGAFSTGPFRISYQATKKLCGHFGVSCPLARSSDFIQFISMASPEQLKRMSKLEKASKK